MTGRTTIEWTDQPGFKGAVWNPTTGCTRVSDGCDNCYAFALHDKRYATNRAVALEFLTTLPEPTTAEKVAWLPKRYPQVARELGMKLPWPRQYDLPFSSVQLLEDRLDAPLKTRTPTCYFVDSMADLFHEDVPDEFIAETFAVMTLADRHRFLILTKRPERMARLLSNSGFVDEVDSARLRRFTAVNPTFPPKNVWLGTSVEDQAAADERIPHLLATPAAVRFLSCEPLLGPVDLARSMPHGYYCGDEENGPGCVDHYFRVADLGGCPIQWVIAGGESGSRARPMDLAWARSLLDQCASADVAFFMKQLGSKPVEIEPWPTVTYQRPFSVRESHGRDMAEWPEDLRIREFPRELVPV